MWVSAFSVVKHQCHPGMRKYWAIRQERHKILRQDVAASVLLERAWWCQILSSTQSPETLLRRPRPTVAILLAIDYRPAAVVEASNISKP